MASYRDLGDGTYEVDTPAGPLRTALSPEELGWAGYQPAGAPPPPDPYAGATAFWGDTPQDDGGSGASGMGGMGGVGNVPDVPAETPGAQGWDPSQGGAPAVSGGGTEGSGAVYQPEGVSGTYSTGAPAEEPPPQPTTRLPEGTQEVELNLSPAAGGAAGGPDPYRPRYHTTKARDQRVGFQVQKGNEALRDETNDQLADLAIDEKLRRQDQADRDEQNLRTQAAMYQRDVVEPAEAELRRQRARAAWIQRETGQRLEALQREREAVDKLQVDPEQIYAGQEWTRALAFLSIIAGGAYQGKTGAGQNPGLVGMNEVINRSIEVQKENYRRRREGLAAQENEFERLMRTYGDPQMAEQELRNRHEAVAAAYAKKFAMDVGADDVKANLAAGFGEIDRKLIEDRLRLDQALSDKVVESYQYIPERTVQVGGRRPETPEARARRVNIDGTPGYVLRPGDAPKVQEANDHLAHLDAQLAEYQQLMNDPDLGPNERKAAADALAMRIGPAMAVLQGQGAMSENEHKNVERALGDAQEWVTLTPDQIQARIGQTRRFFGEKRKVVLQNNVYADPDATQPLLNRAPSTRRE